MMNGREKAFLQRSETRCVRRHPIDMRKSSVIAHHRCKPEIGEPCAKGGPQISQLMACRTYKHLKCQAHSYVLTPLNILRGKSDCPPAESSASRRVEWWTHSHGRTTPALWRYPPRLKAHGRRRRPHPMHAGTYGLAADTGRLRILHDDVVIDGPCIEVLIKRPGAIVRHRRFQISLGRPVKLKTKEGPR
jgi:hypothetical protein